ncbi:MAG TPA: hypothetical protein ENJ60_07410 [Aeromonadales bacterium]|nr:hypothetical protein [Aeromonadales bacterium]
MNIFSKTKIILFIVILIFSETAMSNFLSKHLNASELQEMLNVDKEKDRMILENITISNLDFPETTVSEITFSNTDWKHINGEGRVFNILTFKDCKLEDINFRKIKAKILKFINCELINVVTRKSEVDYLIFKNSKIISTDSNIEHNWWEMKTDKVEITDSDLENISFYDGVGKFYIKQSKLEFVDGRGLKKGSLLEIYDVKATRMDFSNSYLDHLIIKNSFINDSKVNESYIKKVVLDNNNFYDTAITDIKECNFVKADNISELTVGGDVEELKISNCRNGSDVFIADSQFDTVEIEQCNTDEFLAFEAKINTMKLSNMYINRFNINNSNIKSLELNNITISKKLYTKNTQVENYKAINVTVKEGIKRKTGGENITIKSTP